MVARQTLTLFVWVQILVPQPKYLGLIYVGVIFIEAWLSLVERCVRDAEVASSNPVASTNRRVLMGLSDFFVIKSYNYTPAILR